MNSAWKINKIGLINFWFYDEQEFYFLNGRMLLRGSNGSGKSVTMQSVVPLLLDGNMRPERLDPFGSRDRKMSNYLLEENDERDERTGYLYMEFKRSDSETYTTIGMGMRARKGKPLDTWYFAVTDGRRMQKDFHLYKETDVKITLSQKELEYRLLEGSGGRILKNQQEYVEYVNKHIFGFETVEDYKEMVDLLIQLRTPKLSKDFKPSVINEILSDSLQPLSEDDLRPMSEAIENMDNLTVDLQNKKSGKAAADKIFRVYEKYNQYILYQKAKQFQEEDAELQNLNQLLENHKKESIKQNENILLQEQKLQLLEDEYKTLEQEKESLHVSDASRLKGQEKLLEEKIKDSKKNVLDKGKQLEEKEDLQREQEAKKKKTQESMDLQQETIFSVLEVMESAIEDITFDEFSFMAEELKKQLDQPYSFSFHTNHLTNLQSEVKEGTAILQNAETIKQKIDEKNMELDVQKRERDKADKKTNDYENQLVEVQNELKEAIYGWNDKNQELKLSKDLLQDISRFIESYDKNSDYHSMREKIGREEYEWKKDFQKQQLKAEQQLEIIQTDLQEKEKELEEWRTKKEPTPEHSAQVEKNRDKLKRKKIPYNEFYKVIDFGNQMSQEQCNYMEEALLQMGILDALLIDKQYKEEVLALDKGMCDRYIFAEGKHVKNSILDVLEINEDMNDIFMNQKISTALRNIGYEANEGTYVEKDGTYGIGILTGNITGEYQAKYIGVKARALHKKQKIEELELLLKELLNEKNNAEQERNAWQKKIRLLEQEYDQCPKDTDLRQAFLDYEDSRRELFQIRDTIQKMELAITKWNQEVSVILIEAARLAEKLYFPCKLEYFQNALEGLAEYQQAFYQLQTEHSRFVQLVESVASLEEHLLLILEDLDNLRYDKNRMLREMQQQEMELASVKEQLSLTNYEEVKERLDYCTDRLQSIPYERDECVTKREQSKNTLTTILEQFQKGEQKKKTLGELRHLLEETFLEDYALGYYTLQILEQEEGNALELANGILKALGTAVENDKKEELIERINHVYFDNRGYLNEYNLTMNHLFSEEVEDSAMREEIASRNIQFRRIDIVGKYRANRVKFYELIQYLSEEIEELNHLIKAGDKELFEDILANTISRKIRSRINNSFLWVDKMNQLMGSMNTSSGLKLNLRWKSKTAETENQLDTTELVELLKKDAKIMKEEEFEKLSRHFRSKVEEARRNVKDGNSMLSFHVVMKETLDYRKWFEFSLYSQKMGEVKKELTNSVFGKFSGGEKAMAMYVPLFSAVVAKYQGARPDAPRIISLDEAFAGVDNKNIRDMFRLMVEFEFNFILNSQILWGDCDTVDSLAIYQLLRPDNVKYVTVISYIWNGLQRKVVDKIDDIRE